MKLDVTLPAKYAVGTVHQEGIQSLGRNVTFEVIGWYINHYKEDGVLRYIKDGDAIAIKEVNPSVLLQKKAVQKKEIRRIQFSNSTRYRPILRLKGRPIGVPHKQRDREAAIDGLIKIGLVTPEEAVEIFGKTKTNNQDRKVPTW